VISTVLGAMALASSVAAVAAMPSGWIYVSRAPASHPPLDVTARCNDGSWSLERERHRACRREGGVASWLDQRPALLAQSAGDPDRAVR
jgi:hypothetical protein